MGTLAAANLSALWRTLGSAVPVGVEGRLVLQPSLLLLGFIVVPCVILLFCLNCFLLIHRLPAFSVDAKKIPKWNPKPRRPRKRVSNNRRACPDPGHTTRSNVTLCDGHCVSGFRNKNMAAALAHWRDLSGSSERVQYQNGCAGRVSECGSLCPRLLAFSASMPCCSCSQRLCSLTCCAYPHEKPKSWAHQEEEDDGGGGRGSWFRSTRSFCDNETWHGAAPPNSPEALIASRVTPKVQICQKTSTQRKAQRGPTAFTPLGSINFDQANVPCPEGQTRTSISGRLSGPGLDSDFGVSAGISVHILSSDTDNSSLSWTSAMEWDYYDPCYMRRNRRRRDTRHSHHLPVFCSKQHWV